MRDNGQKCEGGCLRKLTDIVIGQKTHYFYSILCIHHFDTCQLSIVRYFELKDPPWMIRICVTDIEMIIYLLIVNGPNPIPDDPWGFTISFPQDDPKKSATR